MMAVPDLSLAGPPLTYPPHILDLLEPSWNAGGPAVIDPDGALSYPELAARSTAVAAALAGHGLGAGEPVVLHSKLSRWAVVGMLGALRAGVRYVPVDASFPAGRQESMITAAGARIALVEPGAPPPGGLHAVPLDATTGTHHTPGPLAYTCFTSGSTGAPTGVTVPAAALASSTAARLSYYPERVRAFLLCSSISFDSSVAGIYWTLACGGTMIIPSHRPGDPLAIGRSAREHQPSHLLLVPSLYGVLLRGGLGSALGSLSTVIVAGESCPPELVGRHVEQLPGARLYNEYGPTECTVWSTVHACVPADASERSVPIGRPIPGTRAWVRTAAGTPAALGEIGELCLSGPGLAMIEGGVREHRTGDFVSVRPDGELLFHGRRDDQLKLGGARIERAEIENALAACTGVREAGVGVGAEQSRGRLVGFVVSSGESLDRKAVRAELLARLPAAAVPPRIEVVAALPRLPNGKLDRRELDRGVRDAAGPM